MCWVLLEGLAGWGEHLVQETSLGVPWVKGPEGVPWVRVLEEDPQQGRWPGGEAWVTEPAAEDPWGRPHSLGLDLVQTSLASQISHNPRI